MEPETMVIFRACKDTGEVTAVFPLEPADHRGNVTCYAHRGQHGGCSRAWYDRETRPARPEEYRDLQRELEGEPYRYRLAIRKRWPRR